MQRLLFIFILTAISQKGIAQSKAEVYAGVLLHVVKYVEWTGSQNNVINIGIVNDPKLVDALNTIVKKKNIQFKNIGITQLNGVDTTGGLNVVFLAKKHTNLCSKINSFACTKKILVITEMKAKEFVCPSINFFEDQGKLKFEIYTSVINKCGFLVSDQLKRFAVLK
ncbi:MAG: YfiR family protein [Bacteroidia bacterium]|jgi:hypothetical protein|nr:YfiR family protein [Bacteroidia bacterium]